jgi:hypothetical protein
MRENVVRRCAGVATCVRYTTNAGSCGDDKIGNGGISNASVKRHRRSRSAALGSAGCGRAGRADSSTFFYVQGKPDETG